MIANNFVWDAMTGDMVAMTILFFALLPSIIIFALASWAKDKITNTNKKGNHHGESETHRPGY